MSVILLKRLRSDGMIVEDMRMGVEMGREKGKIERMLLTMGTFRRDLDCGLEII